MSEPITVVRPGDKLLIRVPSETSLEAVHRLRDQMAGRFPDNEVTVVVCDGLAIVTKDPTR